MENKTKLKQILKYVWIAYGLFSIFIVLYLIDGLVCKDILKVSNRYELTDNWNVTINEDYYENVSLDEFTFDAVNKGDVITMETLVPSDFEYKEACLCMKAAMWQYLCMLMTNWNMSMDMIGKKKIEQQEVEIC